MTRKLLWPVLAIGVLLVALPFVFQLPSRTAAGERMLSDFQPLMQASHVQQTAAYYNNVFVPLGTVATQFTSAAADPQMQKQLTPLMPMLQPVIPTFQQVPAGLAWYKPLVTTMQGNVNDFKSVNALPSFRLFTWFFVVPGLLLVLISGLGLWEGRIERAHLHTTRLTPA
jgi:hypothetical protein